MAVFLVNQCIFSKLPNANNDPNQQHQHHQTNGAGSSQSNQSSSNDSNSNLSSANLAPAGQQATPSNICGQKFDSLFELIHHIENNHIDDVDYAPMPGAGLYYNGAQTATAAGHLQPHQHNYVQYDRHHVNQIINGGWLPTSCILRIFSSTHKTKKQPQQLQPIPQVMQHQQQPQPLPQTLQHQTLPQHPIQQQYQMHQLAQTQPQSLQPAGIPQAPQPTIAGVQTYPAAMQQLQVSTVRAPPTAATVYQPQPQQQQPQIITVPQNIVLSPQAPPMQAQPNLGPQAQPQLAPPQQQPQIITVPQTIVQQQPPQPQMALTPQMQAQQTLQAPTQQTQPTPPPPQVQQQPQIITVAQSPAQMQTDNLPLAKPAKYKCSDCNRTYKTVRGLRTHQTTQHQKPPATPQDSKPPVAVVESGETTSSSCPPDIASQPTSKSPSF